MIVKIVQSPILMKRYRVYMDNGKHYDFGLDGGSTYIDHHDKKLRDAYRARHLGNKTEYELIKNLIPSASIMAYYLLWGDSTSLRQNIENLNKAFKEKYH